MKMCLNPKVLVGLAAAAAVIFVVAPSTFSSALPLLVLAACPISMVLMMRMMGGDGKRSNSEPDADEVALLRAEVAELRLRSATTEVS